MNDEHYEPGDKDLKAVKANDPNARTGRLTAGMLILLLLINAVVSAASVYIYDQYAAQKIAVIDIRGYLTARKNMFLKGDITEKQFTESVDKIEKALNKTDKRTVVLLGDAVVRNAKKIAIEN